MKKILQYLIVIIFVSSSFDIFFNLDLGGFNVRTCYLASFLFAFIYFVSFKDALKFKFIGFLCFAIWFVFPVIFVGNTQFLNRNIGYLMWMIFNLIMCYAIFKYAQLVEHEKLIRLYILSFFVLALVGIVQFLLSLFGVHVFITMWWRINLIPRINAFSYEPSYYATYLMIGFTFLYYSWKRKILYFSERFQILILLSIISAIFLSTSRMGIVFMIGIISIDFFVMLAKTIVSLRISRINLIVSVTILSCLFGTISYIFSNEKLMKQYLAGTGLQSTASHSTDTRIRQMTNVWLIFVDSPIKGVSLGGIAPTIARYYGDNTPDQKKAKEYEGLNIFLEVLAASGIFGFVFFMGWLIFFFKVNIGMSKLLKVNNLEKEAGILTCLKYALIVELLLLIFSQNILRPYLWILIGVTNALYFKFKSQLLSGNEEGSILKIQKSE